MLIIFVTFETSHLDMSPSNSEYSNMLIIFVTFETSHLDMSPLK